MSLRLVSASAVSTQPWQNGGGRTRQLLAWPTADHWTMRVSLADIESDGPFSIFPGATRWFAVVSGAGVELAFANGIGHRLGVGAVPLRFDASAAPHCRLIDGASVDLNLMLRSGEGEMRKIEPGVAWPAAFAVRGLFTNGAGSWSAAGESLSIPPHTLAWTDAARNDRAPWTFVADAHDQEAAAWWIGYTPADSTT